MLIHFNTFYLSISILLFLCNFLSFFLCFLILCKLCLKCFHFLWQWYLCLHTWWSYSKMDQLMWGTCFCYRKVTSPWKQWVSKSSKRKRLPNPKVKGLITFKTLQYNSSKFPRISSSICIKNNFKNNKGNQGHLKGPFEGNGHGRSGLQCPLLSGQTFLIIIE